MPLTPRSLGGLLLPALLSLSPLAANAASEVTILRDQWGIPQVYADDTYGLFAGFGYAVAEDRLFQMEMARRSVLGTVSEVLGPEHVEYDTKTRANFDQAKIRAQIEALPPAERDILSGYAAGWNKRLAEVMADKGALLPKEFTEFGFEPTAWTDFDVAMIYVGTMAGRFSHFSSELNNAKALDALVAQHGEAEGRKLFDQIFWIEDPLAPTTVPAGEQYQQKAEAPAPVDATRFAGLADLPPQAGDDDRPRASNLWILGPEKTTDGSTVLVNGPQFGNFNPAYVFSIGLHGAGFDLTGNTPFAVPNVLFGTNGTIAWGATAGPLDVNDYVELELNPENPHQYRQGDGWADMRLRQETIKVKGARRRHRRRLGDRLRRGPGLRHRPRPRLRLPPHLGRLRDRDPDGLDPLDAGTELRPVARRGEGRGDHHQLVLRRPRRQHRLRLARLPAGAPGGPGPPPAGQGRRQPGLAGHPPLRRRAEDAQPRAGLDRQLEQPLRQGHRLDRRGQPLGRGRPRGRDHVPHRGQGPLLAPRRSGTSCPRRASST